MTSHYHLGEWQDKGSWNKFVGTSNEGSIFCHTDFLDSLETPYRLLKITEGEKGVAAIPILLEKDRPDTPPETPIIAPHPYTQYQGPMFSDDIERLPPHSRVPKKGGILEFALKELASRYRRVSFCLHHRFEDIRPFQWHNYHETPAEKFSMDIRYTGLLDLSPFASFEDYLGRIRKCRVQEYRKAVKENLKIGTGGAGEIDLFLELYLKTFGRQNITLPERQAQLIRAIIQGALDRKFGELLFCRTEAGQAIAATLFLYDNTGSYYLMMANDPEFRKSGGNTHLLLENIRRTQAKGLRWVDFVGINSPNRGDFKLSVNGAPRVYYHVHLHPKPAASESSSPSPSPRKTS